MAKGTALRGYFLNRVSPVGVDMFKSMMDLPKDEAERLNEQFGHKTSQRGNYYDHRVEVETWLRERAQAAGVATENENPLYFTLTPQAEDTPPEGATAVSLRAESIDLSQCSFTLEDSFHNHQFLNGEADPASPSHPLLGQVFNAQQMEEVIRQHRLLDYLKENKKSYIEVQMWARPS